MAVKKTQQEFISDCIRLHGDRYDYSAVVYKSSNEKVTIICKEHGEFQQRASAHLDGQKCPKCSQGLNWSPGKLNTEKYIEKARKVHGNRYDYSKVRIRPSSVHIQLF